ncbi:MAG: ATP-binding cassette domain-containing protein [Comamonas sp.]
MIKFLMPRQLVKRQPDDPQASPHANAMVQAFRAAAPMLRRAAWWSIPISLFGLLPSIFILQVYNRVIYRGGMATLTALVAGVLFFLAIEFWLRMRRTRALRDAGALIDHDVSKALLDSMLNRPLRALEARPSSAWFQLFRDVGAVRSTITGGLLAAVFDLPMAVFALIVIGIVALPVLPVVIAALAILSFLAWWWADEVRAKRVEETGHARDLDKTTSEICQARETLKTLGQDDTVTKMWRQSYDTWLAESFRKNGEIENAREGTTVLLTVFSVVVITVGAIGITQQWMSIGSLMAINLLASKALAPVARLASSWRSLARASEAAIRLEEVLAEPVERASGGLQLPKPAGHLKLSDVSYQFPGAINPVLANINLDIGPCGLHVVVGRNGAGKSTLIKLAAGLYAPTAGTVTIGEYDVAQFSRSEMVCWISTMAQEVYWFSGPLIEALRRSAPEAGDEQIIGACRLAGAHEFISALPQGYRSEVGEGGMGLSVGQRRKLALAQLFLRNPAVLILDEPSNDLDFESETKLLAALRGVARTRTVIAVTHSLRLVSVADQVYHVPGDGSVRQGTPAVMVPKLFGVKRPVAAHAEGQELRSPGAAEARRDDGAPDSSSSLVATS